MPSPQQAAKQIIKPAKSPAAVGPYSQAIALDNLLFAAGQIPLDPSTGELVGTDVREPAGEQAAAESPEQRAERECLDLGAVHVDAGDGWAFTEIRRALRDAQLQGETPWRALSQLGQELGIDELVELAATAFALEPDEDRSLLWYLVPQRIGYRQIMYYVVVKAVRSALRGPSVGWGKLERRGSVAGVG